ncbi:hypothetical protein EG68_04031 [Paragonimus skrjabini miyazakii]|uniref:Drebrin-like protein n=1 Tax=Paragonimus skrjabini miyazakii TaxID=59628 RepID=A0A8S9YZ97_9TREM|nr:hypothetical protein EG68_04031 [Paragonimus skrjabini miyazakii]
MALDLNTNGKLLREAVDAVLDGKYSWVIFGYVGSTFTLDVVNHGLDRADMFEDFSPGRVMFGFARVDHPSKKLTSLPAKFVFIYWQGEGAPEKYRIACSQHGDVVKQFCRTTHITVRARNEDDLDWADIVGKVAKVSGTDYTAPSDRIDFEPQVVGSVYKRVDPSAEIPKGSPSMQFWKMKQSSCDPIPPIPAPLKKPDTHVQPTCGTEFTETDTSKARFQALKAARQSEVSSLIRGRIQSFDQSFDADSSSGYKKIDPRAEILLAKQLSTAADVCDDSTVGTNWQRADPRSEISKAKHLANQCFEPDSSNKVVTKYERTDVQAEIRAARDAQQKNGTDPVTHNHPVPPSVPDIPLPDSANCQPAGDRSRAVNNSKSEPVSSLNQEVATQPPYTSARVDSGLVALCLYNYTAHEDDELSFREGDQIFQVQQIDEGWWLGVTADGRQGLFPANYVELVA